MVCGERQERTPPGCDHAHAISAALTGSVHLSSRSTWRARFRIAGQEHANSRASSPSVRPVQTGSTIRHRFSGGYGGCSFDIWTTPLRNVQVSTKAARRQRPLCAASWCGLWCSMAIRR